MNMGESFFLMRTGMEQHENMSKRRIKIDMEELNTTKSNIYLIGKLKGNARR